MATCNMDCGCGRACGRQEQQSGACNHNCYHEDCMMNNNKPREQKPVIASVTPQEYLVLRATQDNIPLHGYADWFTDSVLFETQDRLVSRKLLSFKKHGTCGRKYEITDRGRDTVQHYEKQPGYHGIRDQKRFCDENMT